MGISGSGVEGGGLPVEGELYPDQREPAVPCGCVSTISGTFIPSQLLADLKAKKMGTSDINEYCRLDDLLMDRLRSLMAKCVGNYNSTIYVKYGGREYPCKCVLGYGCIYEVDVLGVVAFRYEISQDDLNDKTPCFKRLGSSLLDVPKAVSFLQNFQFAQSDDRRRMQ